MTFHEQVEEIAEPIADGLSAKLIRHLGNGSDLAPASPEQGEDLVEADVLAVSHTVEHLGDRSGRHRLTRDQLFRVAPRADVPLGTDGSGEFELCSIVDLCPFHGALRPHRTGIVSGVAVGV